MTPTESSVVDFKSPNELSLASDVLFYRRESNLSKTSTLTETGRLKNEDHSIYPVELSASKFELKLTLAKDLDIHQKFNISPTDNTDEILQQILHSYRTSDYYRKFKKRSSATMHVLSEQANRRFKEIEESRFAASAQLPPSLTQSQSCQVHQPCQALVKAMRNSKSSPTILTATKRSNRESSSKNYLTTYMIGLIRFYNFFMRVKKFFVLNILFLYTIFELIQLPFYFGLSFIINNVDYKEAEDEDEDENAVTDIDELVGQQVTTRRHAETIVSAVRRSSSAASLSKQKFFNLLRRYGKIKLDKRQRTKINGIIQRYKDRLKNLQSFSTTTTTTALEVDHPQHPKVRKMSSRRLVPKISITIDPPPQTHGVHGHFFLNNNGKS